MMISDGQTDEQKDICRVAFATENQGEKEKCGKKLSSRCIVDVYKCIILICEECYLFGQLQMLQPRTGAVRML